MADEFRQQCGDGKSHDRSHQVNRIAAALILLTSAASDVSVAPVSANEPTEVSETT